MLCPAGLATSTPSEVRGHLRSAKTISWSLTESSAFKKKENLNRMNQIAPDLEQIIKIWRGIGDTQSLVRDFTFDCVAFE